VGERYVVLVTQDLLLQAAPRGAAGEAGAAGESAEAPHWLSVAKRMVGELPSVVLTLALFNEKAVTLPTAKAS
jgi:hypothetical protein